MTVTASITTQRGISVSLTVPAGRYRIIRRARLQRAVLPTTPVNTPSFWSKLSTWLLHPNAEQLHARRLAEATLNTEKERQAQNRLFLSFP